MHLSDGTLSILRKTIVNLYSKPFNEALILDTADAACGLLGSHYFAVYIVSGGSNNASIFLSNNPPDFIPVYMSVAQVDFLKAAVAETGDGCVLRRMPDFNIPEHQDFITAVQDARPISDVLYHPIKSGPTLRGFCAIARAGLNSPFFSDDELRVSGFLCSFVNDAFERSLVPPAADEDLAYLDYKGDVLSAGSRIACAFGELFGSNSARLGSEHRRRRTLFLQAYYKFLRGPFSVGMDRVSLAGPARDYEFSFSPYRLGGLYIEQEGVPCARARILGPVPVDGDAAAVARRFSLTPREREVVDGILQCKSNKAIAFELRIDESTVKRYTHNIYEKTGFKTRVELALGLRRD